VDDISSFVMRLPKPEILLSLKLQQSTGEFRWQSCDLRSRRVSSK